MAARKSAPKAEAVAPEAASAGAPTPERPGPTPAEDAAFTELVQIGQEIEQQSDPEPVPALTPPQPVRRYEIARPAPFRAGGHVLTERGWELDTTSPEQES